MTETQIWAVIAGVATVVIGMSAIGVRVIVHWATTMEKALISKQEDDRQFRRDVYQKFEDHGLRLNTLEQTIAPTVAKLLDSVTTLTLAFTRLETAINIDEKITKHVQGRRGVDHAVEGKAGS